jgi:hypothetical protein
MRITEIQTTTFILLLLLLLMVKVKGKVVPVLNKASHHEDVLGDGGIAPHLLDLGTRKR